MAAFVRLDQVGLATGTPGRSRTVGLATGAQITVTNTNPNSKFSNLELLAWPLGDTGSVATLLRTGDNSFTWSPTASRYGSFRIKVTENPGTALERVEIRIFGIRFPNGLLMPAPNTRANPVATMATPDASALVDESEDNADDYVTSGLNAWRGFGWWRSLYELFVAAGGGGGGLTAFNGRTDPDVVPQADDYDWTKITGLYADAPIGATLLGSQPTGSISNAYVRAAAVGPFVMVSGRFWLTTNEALPAGQIFIVIDLGQAWTSPQGVASLEYSLGGSPESRVTMAGRIDVAGDPPPGVLTLIFETATPIPIPDATVVRVNFEGTFAR